jgi:hypothetical protein
MLPLTSYGWYLLLTGQEDPTAACCATAMEGTQLQQLVTCDYPLVNVLLPCGGCIIQSGIAADIHREALSQLCVLAIIQLLHAALHQLAALAGLCRPQCCRA